MEGGPTGADRSLTNGVKLPGEKDEFLIVIGAQHRQLLESTILGTTSVRVMRHASCPVLTIARHDPPNA